tara:strand:+ start:89 stop:370 length:282 start_codon:yes stop_codon:yes gene_type:complete
MTQSLDKLVLKGLISVTVKAIEFNPKPDPGRYPSAKHKPTLWEARFSSGANGDVVAKRETPEQAFRDGMAAFMQHKKPVKRTEPDDDDGMDLI